MDNQIDNDLKNHIRDIFENFEDPSADAGWLLLRKKYPAKQRRAAAWLWWSAAAALLLFVGISLFNNYSTPNPEKVSYKTIKTDQQNLAISKQQTITKSTIDSRESTPATINNKQIANHTFAAHVYIKATSKPDKSLVEQPVYNKTESTDQQLVANKVPPIVKDSSATTVADNGIIAESVKKPIADDIIISPNSIIRKPIATVYKTNTDRQPIAKISTDKKVTFSIYEATYFNYAKGSGTQINAGAGITSDINLSTNLKLSTGVALAQNTLNYVNGLNTGLMSDNPITSTNGTGFIAPQSLNARLISLDVPVNLKYQFNSPSKTFISAGFSSGTFINETYTTGTQQNQSTTTNKSFDNFYFARILNVSFGMSYPLGKTNSLVIEPFVKYPLGGLGAQQILFGSGGINLKFNFKPTSK